MRPPSLLISLVITHAQAFKHYGLSRGSSAATEFSSTRRRAAATLPNSNDDILGSVTPASDKLNVFPRISPLRSSTTDADAAAAVCAPALATDLTADSATPTANEATALAKEAGPLLPAIATPTLKALLAFTLGALPIYVSPCLLTVIDTGFVGRVSSLQLAALGPACAICDGLASMCIFISVGTTNAVSSSLAVGDRAGAQRSVAVSQTMSAAIGTVLAVALYNGVGPCVAHFTAGASPASAVMWHHCVRYVQIRALSFPATLMMMSAQAACLGGKDALNPMRATLLAASVNVVGDFWLVSKLGLGAAGAAWATVGCQVVGAAALFHALLRNGLLKPRELLIRPARAELKRFFAFGAFVGVLICKIVVYNQATALAVILGPTAGAAHQVINSLSRFCYTLGDVTGATAQAFLPQCYRPNPDGGGGVTVDAPALQATVTGILKMTCLVAGVAAAIALAVPVLKPGWFTPDPAVAALMAKAAPFAALGMLLHPSVVGMEGCLLATRQVTWLVRNYAAIGVASVAATQALLAVPWLRAHLGISTIWLFLAAFQFLRCASFARHLRATVWPAAPPAAAPPACAPVSGGPAVAAALAA